MKIERTKNAVRNTKWGILQNVMQIIMPFLVRTVLIHTIGAEFAGLSSLFTSILSILSLTELGFSNAIVYSMYKPIAEDNKEKICALLHVYRKAYYAIGSIILGVGVTLIPFLPNLINGEIPNEINLYILYIVYLVNTVISYFLYGFKTSLIAAYQRQDIQSKNILLQSIILYGFQCILLITTKNYYLYAIMIPLCTVLLNLLNNHAVNKMFPDYQPKGKIDDEERKTLKKNVLGLTIWKIGGSTRNTLDSIVVSMYLGLKTVTMYNNYFDIVHGVSAFVGVILTSITAGIGNKIAVETPERNYEDFNKFHFYYMWIAGWCTVCMMCLYQPFMKIWMGEELMLPDSIMFLFCYYFIMLKQGDINSVYYQAAGLWWHGKLRSIIEAVLNLVLNFVLGRYFGVKGILLATIISYTCIYFYGSKFIFSEYFKNRKLVKFFSDNVIYLMVTGVVAFGTFKLVGILTEGIRHNVIVLFVSGMLCIVLPNLAFAIIYGTNKQNRQYLQEALLKFRAKLLR